MNKSFSKTFDKNFTKSFDKRFIVDLSDKESNELISKFLNSRGYKNFSSWKNIADNLNKSQWSISITSNLYVRIFSDSKSTKKLYIHNIPNKYNIKQLINHYPNPYCITEKFNLTKTLRNLQDFNFSKDFYPKTYLLNFENKDEDIDIFEKDIDIFLDDFKIDKGMWIVKPSNLRRGEEIKIYDNLEDITEFIEKNHIKSKSKEFIIQKYISNPLLYKGRKFDVRIHCLIDTDFNLYINHLAFIRLTSQEYTPILSGNWNEDKFIHITNHAIQKYSKDYNKYEESNMKVFNSLEFKELYDKFIPIWSSIIKNIVAGSKKEIKAKTAGVEYGLNREFYELLGFDFLIDENMKTWLLEINMNPGIFCNNKEIDYQMNFLVNDMFKIVVDKSYNITDNSWFKI